LDPHGAVGYVALERYEAAHKDGRGFFLETAHPVKFGSVVKLATGEDVKIPESMEYILKLRKQSIAIQPEYSQLKKYLLKE
jgi:threonine synthase